MLLCPPRDYFVQQQSGLLRLVIRGGDRQNRRSPKMLVLCVGAVLKRAVGVPRGRVSIGDFAGTVYSKSNNEDAKKEKGTGTGTKKNKEFPSA